MCIWNENGQNWKGHTWMNRLNPHPPPQKKKNVGLGPGGPAIFLAAPDPNIFFSSGSGSGSWFFPKRLRLLFFERLRLQEAKKTCSGSWLLVKFGKIYFSPQTSKVKLQKI